MHAGGTAPDPATPLWRAAQVFRLLSCLYALGFQIAINDDLDRPAIGWALFAVLISWSVGLRGWPTFTASAGGRRGSAPKSSWSSR